MVAGYEVAVAQKSSGVVPVFPLPEVVFFPETTLPLHIFEPRYREMVRDVEPRSEALSLVKLHVRVDLEKDYRDTANVVGVRIHDWKPMIQGYRAQQIFWDCCKIFQGN